MKTSEEIARIMAPITEKVEYLQEAGRKIGLIDAAGIVMNHLKERDLPEPVSEALCEVSVKLMEEALGEEGARLALAAAEADLEDTKS